jgi:hypothetical protein
VITELHRTLEQELLALLRGVSLECLLCGEFVMRTRESIFCPECGTALLLQQADTGAAETETG